MIEQRAIAYADLTYLFAGVVFVALALLDNEWAPLFGIYTCACYLYFVAIWIPETLMLMKNDLSPAKRAQLPFFYVYGFLFAAFGLFGSPTECSSLRQSRIPDVPLGGARRSGPTGSATQMCHDRRAVDVEHRSELSDRCPSTPPADEIVHLGGRQTGLHLTLRSNALLH